jgi:hypothetical protein
MKLKLIDACDKMGPRIRHVLNYFVRERDLSAEAPPAGARTYLKISNQHDFKVIARRLKLYFSDLLSDEAEFSQDGFSRLMPKSTLSLPGSNCLLLSYADSRIEAMVCKLMKDKMDICRVYDTRTTADAQWIGIVLRNIPEAKGQEI